MDEYTVPAHSLSSEATIVWRIDPTAWPYLRETTFLSSSRSRAPRRHEVANLPPGGVVIGYAVSAPDAPPTEDDAWGRTWLRRVWWSAEHDPYAACGLAGYPCEAVWTPSIAAGRSSRRPTQEDHDAAHSAHRARNPDLYREPGRWYTLEEALDAPPLLSPQVRAAKERPRGGGRR